MGQRCRPGIDLPQGLRSIGCGNWQRCAISLASMCWLVTTKNGGNRQLHLGHVNIQVRNVEAAHAWYTRILGLHTYQFVPGAAAFLSANIESSHEIALIEVGPDAPGQAPKQVGLNHMAWMVDTLDELRVLYQRLKANGVPIRSIVDHGLSLGIYFRDPDGNGVEVSFEQPRSEWPRQERLFARDITNLGRFPGPWDDDPAYDRRAGVLQRFAETLATPAVPA